MSVYVWECFSNISFAFSTQTGDLEEIQIIGAVCNKFVRFIC